MNYLSHALMIKTVKVKLGYDNHGFNEFNTVTKNDHLFRLL